MEMKYRKTASLILYQALNGAGAIEFKGNLKKQTLWASLDQIATLFDRDKSVVSRYIKKIFKD